MLKCPKCGSEDIGQYRQLTGPIWCGSCGFRVEQKEIKNPFDVKVERKEKIDFSNDEIKDILKQLDLDGSIGCGLSPGNPLGKQAADLIRYLMK